MSAVPPLFDANGSFGRRAAGGAEFSTLRSRLDHMDRLGIARALVWNVESEQDYALASNRRLLGELADTPGAQGRIIPALSVSGLTEYERGGTDAFLSQMKSSRTRALRFANVFGRLTLCQLEPVIRRVRALKPFLILRHSEASPQDILEFTSLFPEMPLILTEVWWGQCIVVFDLMRRRKNVLIDTSWLHSCGAIELIARRFGAERLVFSCGPKAHNGAAVAALARADLTPADRRKIAHGNLERLLGSKPGSTAPVAVSVAEGKTLWRRFLDGQPLRVDIVDAHGHLGPSGGYVLETQDEQAQLHEARKRADAIGIRTMLFSGLQALLGSPVAGNNLLESLLKPHGRRFAGYLAFNPFYAAELVPSFDRWFGGSVFVGFKTLCDYWQVPVTDRRFRPMWAYADRHRLPVLAHTWEGPYDSPAMFRKVVQRYPNLQLLLGHSGGPDKGRREAEQLAREHRNVYLEWCGSFLSSIPWEETIATVGRHRVVFGTDAMAHDMRWELGRLLSLNVPDTTLIPILGGNMRRILALRR